MCRLRKSPARRISIATRIALALTEMPPGLPARDGVISQDDCKEELHRKLSTSAANAAFPLGVAQVAKALRQSTAMRSMSALAHPARCDGGRTQAEYRPPSSAAVGSKGIEFFVDGDARAIERRLRVFR